jgi:hypothetical protein
MSYAEFVQLQCATLKQSGIQLAMRGGVFVSLGVPYCGVSIPLSLELSDASQSSSTLSGLIVDLVLPRELAGVVSLADFASLQNAVPCVASNRTALLNVVSDVMQHVAAYHAAKARAIANERWQFELQTTLAPRSGVLFHCPDDGLSVSCSVPLITVELPKYYSLYGTDTRAASLLVRFDLARMTSHAPTVAVSLPNRLERMLHVPMSLPAWSTGTCLSEYVPLVARFLGDFCHAERIRRSVFSSLVKLLGSRLEIDHVHYLRGRFMRRSSATNPPTIVILHVDLPLEFPRNRRCSASRVSRGSTRRRSVRSRARCRQRGAAPTWRRSTRSPSRLRSRCSPQSTILCARQATDREALYILYSGRRWLRPARRQCHRNRSSDEFGRSSTSERQWQQEEREEQRRQLEQEEVVVVVVKARRQARPQGRAVARMNTSVVKRNTIGKSEKKRKKRVWLPVASRCLATRLATTTTTMMSMLAMMMSQVVVVVVVMVVASNRRLVLLPLSTRPKWKRN